MPVVVLGADEMRRRSAEFVALLADAIESGASVGYMLPVDEPVIDAYWQAIAAEVESRARIVFAVIDGDRVVGSVQLAPSPKPNQPHRADVQKLLVHREFRRRGDGVALMNALEQHARASGRWLLTLDTRTGSAADLLYRRWGWQTIGRVPAYALDPDGTLADCTFYWKRLA